MREKIKQEAHDLLIQHGYRGLRFGDIALRLAITRANVHYHFGTKEKLVDEVVRDHLALTLERLRAIWLDPEATLNAKIAGTMEFTRERHQRFNDGSEGARPWSLIARMRLERDLLSPATKAQLMNYNRELHALMIGAIELDKRRGELVQHAPTEEIGLQVANIANCSDAIIRDAGTFSELERLYTGLSRLIEHAYGAGAGAAGRPAPGALARAGRSEPDGKDPMPVAP